MIFFKNGTGWCRSHEPNKKVPSAKSHAPIFRQQALQQQASSNKRYREMTKAILKRSSSEGSSENLRSSQALEQSNTGRKPASQGLKPQAIIYKFQDPRSRVQAHKRRVRGPGNEDK